MLVIPFFIYFFCVLLFQNQKLDINENNCDPSEINHNKSCEHSILLKHSHQQTKEGKLQTILENSNTELLKPIQTDLQTCPATPTISNQALTISNKITNNDNTNNKIEAVACLAGLAGSKPVNIPNELLSQEINVISGLKPENSTLESIITKSTTTNNNNITCGNVWNNADPAAVAVANFRTADGGGIVQTSIANIVSNTPTILLAQALTTPPTTAVTTQQSDITTAQHYPDDPRVVNNTNNNNQTLDELDELDDESKYVWHFKNGRLVFEKLETLTTTTSETSETSDQPLDNCTLFDAIEKYADHIENEIAKCQFETKQLQQQISNDLTTTNNDLIKSRDLNKRHVKSRLKLLEQKLKQAAGLTSDSTIVSDSVSEHCCEFDVNKISDFNNSIINNDNCFTDSDFYVVYDEYEDDEQAEHAEQQPDGTHVDSCCCDHSDDEQHQHYHLLRYVNIRYF